MILSVVAPYSILAYANVSEEQNVCISKAQVSSLKKWKNYMWQEKDQTRGTGQTRP